MRSLRETLPNNERYVGKKYSTPKIRSLREMSPGDEGSEKKHSLAMTALREISHSKNWLIINK